MLYCLTLLSMIFKHNGTEAGPMLCIKSWDIFFPTVGMQHYLSVMLKS